MPQETFALIQKIAESGLLGLLLALALVVIYFQQKTILSDKDKAIKKGEQMNITLKSVNDTMKELFLDIRRQPYDQSREKKKSS